MNEILKEACVESLEQALLAERCGADRIELCADLSEGGLTPDSGLIESAVAILNIPVMVMVRPRAGNFGMNHSEIESMKRTIDFCKKVKAAGVVFGLLNAENEVDAERTAELAELAQPLQVTFHKAIDETPDIVKSVDILNKIPGIQRILSSGGKATAMEGSAVLRLMGAAAWPVTIIAAGRITTKNLHEVHRTTGLREYHGRRIVF